MNIQIHSSIANYSIHSDPMTKSIRHHPLWPTEDHEDGCEGACVVAHAQFDEDVVGGGHEERAEEAGHQTQGGHGHRRVVGRPDALELELS